MMLPKAFSPEDYTAMLARLRAENDFVAKLNTFIVMPKNQSASDEDSEDEPDQKRKDSGVLFGKTARAQSVAELQERLRAKMAELRGGRDESKSKSTKVKLSKAERKKKAKEAKKLMKRIAQSGKNGDEILTSAKAAGGSPVKPVYNNDGKMVFSKFDFSEEQTEKKKPKIDPKSALQKIQKQKEKIHNLESDGRVEKAQRLETNVSWGAALAKAEGVRVKDDVALLKKSIKKKDQRKKSSKKKWEGRDKHVESKKEAAQHKRTGNIQKRKEEKKKHKNKRAAKKGRLVPGFG